MSQPTHKLPCPFADGAIGNSFLPTNSDETTGRAGWSGGFPEVTAKPISAGGIPPHYSDFQMALNGITQQICFLQNGGRYRWDGAVVYDPGSVVLYGGKVWQALPTDGQNVGQQPGQAGGFWGEVAAVDGSTIVTSAGKMSVAPQSLADGKTIVSSGGKLAVNLSGVAGKGLSATVSGGQPKLAVNYSVAASDLAGVGLSATAAGKLNVINQGGGQTSQALALNVGGEQKWTYNGAVARTIDIKGSAGQINVAYSNGAVVLSLASKSIPAGAIMLFHGGAVPAGWTLLNSATYNNVALRLVNKTSSAGSGGANAFTKALNAAMATTNATQGGTVGAHKLTISEIPPHNHTMKGADLAYGKGKDCVDCGFRADYGSIPDFPTRNAGGGKAHSHTFKGEAHKHSVTLDVKYVDVFFARKNP